MAAQPDFRYQLTGSRLLKINIESLVPPDQAERGGLFFSYTFQVVANEENKNVAYLRVNLEGHGNSGDLPESPKVVTIDTTIQGEYTFNQPITTDEVEDLIPEMALCLMPLLADIVESNLHRTGLRRITLPRSFRSNELETTKPLTKIKPDASKNNQPTTSKTKQKKS